MQLRRWLEKNVLVPVDCSLDKNLCCEQLWWHQNLRVVPRNLGVVSGAHG